MTGSLREATVSEAPKRTHGFRSQMNGLEMRMPSWQSGRGK